MQPSNLVSWMQQLNLSPGASAYQQAYPLAVTSPYAGYADWQARSLPGISPAYLPHAAQSSELFAAHDLLASAPGYPDEAKGDDGEELEGGPEGEGKTRSKMQEKNRRVRHFWLPAGCVSIEYLPRKPSTVVVFVIIRHKVAVADIV